MALSQAALDLIKENLAKKKGIQEKTSSEENKTESSLSKAAQDLIAQNVALKKLGITENVSGNDSSGSKARVVAPVSSYSLEIGKNGYNRYLSDKQREAQKKQEEEDDLKWWERVFRYMGSSPDSTLVGSNMTLATEALREDTSWKEPSDEWNDEERYTFGWLYQSDKKAAEEYAAKVNNAINKAKTDAEREEIKKGVSESFDKSTGTAFVDAAGKTLGSVVNSTLGGADFLYDLAEQAARGQITEKDYLSPFERSQVGAEAVANELNTRGGTIKEDVPIIGGKGWGDVYGLGTSIAQSSVAAYTGGAPQALIQFFGSAAATGVDDAKARGASDDQAIAFGITSGLAEAIPEAFGVEKLLKIGTSDTLKSLLVNIIKQSGVEGIEEGSTSVINNIADNIIMTDLSTFNALKNEYRAIGMSEKEAEKQAWLDTLEGIAFDSLAGFVSGGIHAGPQTAFQTVMANKEAVSTYGESVNELIEEGLSTPEGTRSHELAQEYKAKLDQKKTLSGAEIRMMVEANENQFTAEDTAKIQEAAENRLRQLGESDNVSAIAQILTKQAGGETISKAQQKVLEASKYGQRVANEMNPQNIRSGGYASEWTRDIGTERINADLYNLAQETAGVNKGAETAQKNAGAKVSASEVNSPTKTETVVQGEYKTSDNGKTISNETGAETSVAEITSIKGGKMTLKLENGEEVDAKNVSFGSQGEALVYETVANLPDINASAANLLIKNMGLGKASAEVYARGIEEAYTFGAHNIPVTEMMDDVAFFKDLTEQQRMQAYRLGQSNHKAATQVKEETVRKNRTVAEKKAGRVHFEGDIESLNKRQKASYDAIERIADALGIEIYLFESPVVNGKRKGANGWYDTKDGSIHLDIYAGQNGEGTMLFTAAHELTHFIKQWSPAKFDILADFLMEEYGKKGVSVNELVRAQQEKARRNKRELSYDEAFEEVVADSMETMLADGKVMEKLEKLKAQDQTLWEKIKDFIADLVKKIKEVYAGLTPNSEEGQYVAEMVDAIERIQELFTEGITEAAENFRTIGSIDLEQFADAKNTDGEQLFQYRAMESDEDTYRSMLKKWGKFSDAQINNLFTTIDKAMDIIKDNLEILDYAWEADINDRAFSPVKPNSDSLYQVSIDFSTLCRKRLLQQTVQAQLQEALKRPMTKEEGIAIRDALMAIQEEGRQIEIACALCYVESARMKSPAQIKKFLGNREAVLKDFFVTKSGGDIKGKIKQAEADARERLGVGDTSLKSLSNKVADQIRAAKKEAKASYIPTAEEQKLIDAAMKMTVSDFTTPAGLENLAKNYRGIFDAYTSYVRNATKSKGIENDTWWRAGDSEKIGDTLIANMNKENGLRSQSWSDFQVIHMMDYIAAVIELSTRNSKMQAYTKVPDYVELMGKTGAMINLSLIPTRDYLGTLDYDSTEGMDYKKSLELRDKYHGTVGTICIGVDNNQIKQLLEDMTIDYVIPYHKSGMSAHVRKAMHIPTWDQYEEYQSEKNLSDAEAKANADKYGVKLLDKSDPDYHKHTSFSEWFDLKEAQQIAKMENAHPSDPAKQKKYGVMYGGYMAMQNAANNYLKLCAERGLAPVFSHKKADFTGEDNYWKVLIDRKMVDNITGEVIEQKAIQPVFDEAEVLRILNDELERYPKVKEDQEYAIRRVTEKFLSGDIKGGMSSAAVAKAMQKPVDNITETNIVEAGKEMDEVKLSDRDSDGRELSKEQQEYFENSVVRDAEGRLLTMYHGTANGGAFTIFEGDKLSNRTLTSQIGQGFYFTNVKEEAKAYMHNVDTWGRTSKGTNPYLHEVYLNITNPLNIKDSLDLDAAKAVYMDGDYDWFFDSGLPGELNNRTVNGVKLSKAEVQTMTKEEKASLYVEYLNQIGGTKEILKNMPKAFHYNKQSGLLEAMKRNLGYDGIVDEFKPGKFQYVAFSSEQIKNADNKTPTTDPDIRYSDREFSEEFVTDTVNSFGINKLGDYIHVQRQVFDTLTNEGFFTDTEARSRTDVNEDSGMVIETNKSGIDETFSLQNYARVGKNKKITKLATIRMLPEMIRYGKLVGDDVENLHNPADTNKKFAYISYTANIDGKDVPIKLTVKKSLEKNKFWVHSVEIKNVSNYPAGSDNTTGAGYRIADNGKSIASEDGNVKNSLRDVEHVSAPTFYSYMGKVVDGIKSEKVGAGGVIPYLKGKGVKDEEIKWSGIEAFLEGKKSVTKQELQEFVAGSMLQIEEQLLFDEEVPFTKEEQEQISKYEAERDIIAENLKSEWKRIVGKDIPIVNFVAGLESAVFNNLFEANADKKGETEVGYKYRAAKAALQRVIEDNNEDWGYDTNRQAFREAVRNPESFMSANEMSSFQESVFKDFIKAKKAYDKEEGIPIQEQKALLGIAASADRISYRINKIREENRAKRVKRMPIWEQFKLRGGKNYRELKFIMPNSSYTNQAMQVHWGYDAEGVLVHTRVQDFETDKGTMLFIEELQSDWHNEGHKKGYVDESKKLNVKNTEVRLENGWYNLYHDGRDLHQGISEAFLKQRFAGGITKEEIHEGLVDEYNRAMEHSGNGWKASDAPFKTNYHEFVLKRLIREAAEKGYDSIGWTPAKIQEERWSEEFAEGYRIEYDQDMPAFLKKYGKKWGAKVDKTELENGESIWFMPITDAMKESVVSEGQPLYQERSDIADRNRAVVLQKKVERLEKELTDLERAYKKAQDYARAEGILAGQIEQGAQMAKELRQKQESFNRKAEGYEESIEAKRKKIAEIRAQRDELLEKARAEKREALANARQKAAETQKEIITRYQESRKKAVESRHQTEMRHKIKGVVNELDQMLRKQTKDKHIPEHMKGMVARALDAIDLFDPKYYDIRIESIERQLVGENDPAVRAELKIKLDKYKHQKEQAEFKVSEIKDAYRKIMESSDPIVQGGYDEVVAQRIDNVVEAIGDTAFGDMSISQLEEVYKLFKMFKAAITNTNRAFTSAKAETISEWGDKAVEDLSAQERKNKETTAAAQLTKSFFYWNNLKPVYFFRKLGSRVFENLFESLRKGEDVWAVDVNEATEFAAKIKEKYHYKKWYNQNNPMPFETSTGKKFKLTVQQMMSIYAYSKRKDADKHLSIGGFVFDSFGDVVKKKLGIKIKYKTEDANAYNISADTIKKIVGALTQEQRDFVDEMQTYLSKVMGGKGNEVSMAMYDIKLFGEENYFPLKSAQQYNAEMEQENKTAGQIKIKNAGFTKARVPGANNPIILSDFMDVWANHVNDMSMYHAFTLPIEDMNKVFNYKTPLYPNQKAVRGVMTNAFGEGAVKYFDQFLKDINGNAVGDSRESFGKTITSRFKKAAVAASLSVAIQQPSAIVRAFAVINPKYIFGLPKIPLIGHGKLWNEIKKYAPIAVVKEMGRFDMNTGIGAVDYIKGEKGAIDKLDDITGALPAYMDEATWGTIWHMVKRETKAKNKNLNSKSDEFLKLCGERFTEIIVKTQVYDSTLSRSANMRSKNGYMGMLTAFMAEPTTSLNMFEDAFARKNSGGAYKAKIATALLFSVIFNSALAAFVYAARDDDEDETYWEKYVQSVSAKLIDSLNPLTYFSFLKDMWSIMQGYDVERIDMSLFAKAYKALEKLSELLGKDTEDMTEEELEERKKAIFDSALDSIGTVLDLVGIPLKNALRDIEAIWNVISIDRDMKSTGLSMLHALEGGVTNATPDIFLNVVGYETKTKADKLYEAIMSGDEVYEARLRESTPEYQLRGALRGNDPRIREAAQAKIDGDMQTYLKLAKEVIADGFSQNDVVRAINTQITNMSKEETETESTDNSLTGFFTVDEYLEAVLGRDQASANAIKNDIINTSIANGRDRETAEEKFYSSLYSSIKDAYDEGSISADKAKEVFVKYGNKTETSANSTVDLWKFKKDYPDTPVESYYLDKYYESIADSGVDIKTYVDYRNEAKNCEGTDKDGDGKTDSGSVKAQKLPIINALPITKEQKDAIYYSEGWAKSTIHEAPWR